MKIRSRTAYAIPTCGAAGVDIVAGLSVLSTGEDEEKIPYTPVST